MKALTGKKHHLKIAAALLFALTLCVAAAACGGKLPDDHIDLADTFEGEGIVTAEQLVDFIENGTGDTASLLVTIDLEREMLKVPAARGSITIEGNGCSIVGNGDCVIRLDDGASVSLNKLSIVGSGDGIGCLGNASVGGEELSVTAAGNGIVAKGLLTVADGSAMSIEAIEGSALTAKGVTLGAGARVSATAGLNAVHTTKNELVLNANAELYAYTSENYNAVKCADTLVMEEGSVFEAENSGDYHGAEIDTLSVNGVVTIRCKGGGKGMGMFVFTQEEDICVIGSCTPEAQYENGAGSITFVNDMTEYGAWLEEQRAAEAAQEEETTAPEGDADTEDEG